MTLNGYKLKCDFSVGEAIGQIIIWILLSVITFGLALFVLPYYFLKAPMNRSTLVDPAGNIGHALFWLLLSIITLGLAYFVYWPAVIKRLLNAATIRPL